MDSPLTKLAFECARVFHRIHSMSRTESHLPAGVTASEASALRAVHADKWRFGSARPGRVAALLKVTKGALSQTLRSLEEKGLIERARSAEDYRAVTVELTERGTEVVRQTFKLDRDFCDGLMDFLGEEDLRHLLSTMNKVLEFQEKSGSFVKGESDDPDFENAFLSLLEEDEGGQGSAAAENGIPCS